MDIYNPEQIDLHDIGKNLVAMMMKGIGATVYDVGVDTDPSEEYISDLMTVRELTFYDEIYCQDLFSGNV